jgi:hypothetical protein
MTDPMVVPEVNEEKLVSSKAYSEVKTDMLKFKEQKKVLEQELEKLKADEQVRKEAEQVKNGEFQKLADQYKLKFEEAESKREAELKRVLDLQKIHTLDKELGGFHKPEYSRIAVKLDAIKMTEDGFVDQESVKAEVERIKREHPALLKQSSHAKLPNQSSQQASTLSYQEQVKQCKTIPALTSLMEKHGKA